MSQCVQAARAAIANWGIDADWTLFLDRDGVLNYRPVGDYVRSPEQLRLLPGTPTALRALRGRFARVVVVTNQQGVGKGLMTDADLDRVHARLRALLPGLLDGVYACTALAGAPGDCRKPGPALAELAAAAHPGIALDRSVMVGDSDSDVAFGARVGMRTVYVGEAPTPPGTDLTLGSLSAFARACSDD